MKGILQGLKVTLSHLLRKKVTRLYPYEKREPPERSRGVIKLILEPKTGEFECESCLFCEKICPPRAISISCRERGAFRKRPPFSPQSVSDYFRPRLAVPSPYYGRPIPSLMRLAANESEDLSAIDSILAAVSPDPASLAEILAAIDSAYGYLPPAALRRLAQITGITISCLFEAATLCPGLRLESRPSSPADDEGGSIASDHDGGIAGEKDKDGR
ncbi:MAG: hypothetical protein HYX88_00355 [Chloroflexi bacterium]|nr:hypothetical protein [Chloroflexota bacterium]